VAASLQYKDLLYKIPLLSGGWAGYDLNGDVGGAMQQTEVDGTRPPCNRACVSDLWDILDSYSCVAYIRITIRLFAMEGQGIARDTHCPLCKEADSLGHILGSCTHSEVKIVYLGTTKP
jgi:hypothetical protein